MQLAAVDRQLLNNHDSTALLLWGQHASGFRFAFLDS
jgi:hypothetical protein